MRPYFLPEDPLSFLHLHLLVLLSIGEMNVRAHDLDLGFDLHHAWRGGLDLDPEHHSGPLLTRHDDHALARPTPHNAVAHAAHHHATKGRTPGDKVQSMPQAVVQARHEATPIREVLQPCQVEIGNR